MRKVLWKEREEVEVAWPWVGTEGRERQGTDSRGVQYMGMTQSGVGVSTHISGLDHRRVAGLIHL